MSLQRCSRSLLVVVFVALMPLLVTSAQELPATPVPGLAPTGVLAEFPIDVLPTPHAEVWFLRMGLEPGGSLPPEQQIGLVVVYVESGELTLVSDRPLTVSMAGEDVTPGAVEASPLANGFETALQPGDSVLVDGGTTLTATNQADAPTTFLIVLMYPAEREGEAGEGGGQPVGVTQQGISVGTAEFPPAAGTVTIERVVVEPDGIMTTEIDAPQGIDPGWMGIELGAIESGSADVDLESRTFQHLIWPGITTGGLIEPVQIPLTATVQLEPGDGYAAFNSTLSWTSTGHEPLIVLRVMVMPVI